MRVESVTQAMQDWFVAAVLPQLEWYEQLAAGIALRPTIEQGVAKALPRLEQWGLLKDGSIDGNELMDRLSDTVFRTRDELPVTVAGHTFSLRLANIREILAAAAAKERGE